MKRILLISFLGLAALSASAQTVREEKKNEPDYQFTTIKENPVTSVKNQYRSGTCWCFSGISFLESELMRTQNKEYDLSEMWVVSHSYSDRAVKYVRMDGRMGFSAGSGFGDVFEVIRRYGIVPKSVYSGMQYGTELPEQAELDAVLKAYVNAVVTYPHRDKPLTTAWKKGVDAVLQAYMGQWPDCFEADGVSVTPREYADKVLKFNRDDYVNICSFLSEPWYEECPVEVCDNWRNANAYNVPVADMLEIMYKALDDGYTILWGGDVSEKGFTRNGLAVLPVPEAKKSQAGSDQEHWVGKEEETEDVKDVKDVKMELPAEIEVSDSLRQDEYDRKLTTDDHGMHIFGYAKDQNGTKYFLVKNSWGETGKYKGIWYMSETFIAGKTLNFVVNKKALSKDMRKKLDIK